MKTVLIFLLVMVIWKAGANNYYFSSSTGDDSRTSTQAQNPATPWQNISKLNSFFSSLSPGDSVLFRRGETFYGQVVLNKSGTLGNEIVVGAYGSGADPIITGMTALTWTSLGGSKYASQALTTNGTTISSMLVVTLNGKPQAMGRYPDASSGYLTIQSYQGASSIYQSALPATDFTGGELVIETNPWLLNKYTITRNQNDTIYYPGTTSPANGYNFFIQDDSICVTSNNEWWYSPVSQRVIYYNSTGTPSGVQASIQDTVVRCNGFDYITFYGVVIEGANRDAVGLYNSSDHITFINTTIRNTGFRGIKLSSSDYLNVQYSTLKNNLNNGIDMGSGSSRNATIIYNTIDSTGMLPGMGASGENQYEAVYARSDSGYSIIKYNKIRFTGYNAIYFSGKNDSIMYNYIQRAVDVKDDGGAIYGANYENLPNRVIMNNIIDTSGSDGVYGDQGLNSFVVKNNVIKQCANYGVYLHGGKDINVSNNQLFNARVSIICDGSAGYSPVRDTVKNNVMFTSNRASYLLQLASCSTDDIGSFGVIDSNYYLKPLDVLDSLFKRKIGTASATQLALSPWRAAYPSYDIHSWTSSISYASTAIQDTSVMFVSNNTSSSIVIDLGGNIMQDVYGNLYYGYITQQSFTGTLLFYYDEYVPVIIGSDKYIFRKKYSFKTN